MAGKGWMPVLILAIAVGASAAGAERPLLTRQISPDLRAVFSSDFEITVLVKSHPGDAWTRLARRITGDAANWKAIADLNSMGDTLKTDHPVSVPFALLRPELRKQTIQTLFDGDHSSQEGWVHKVIGGSGIEGESLWNIAAWFTGDGANYRAVRQANDNRNLSTRRGEEIVVPANLLSAEFQSEAARKAAPAAEETAAEDDPAEPQAAAVADVQPTPPAPVGPVHLDYVLDSDEPHAIYHLQRGEAIYSAVAIRFTGRIYAKDVGEVIDRLVKFNNISDVARLPVGFPVKIPLELLVPDFRPANDPRRLEAEQSRRESARLARRVEAKNLQGVTVILDAGHGGRDVGTSHDGMYESDYVYDVMCRLKRELEKKTKAKVWTTTRSKFSGYGYADDDDVPRMSDQMVLTSPPYPLDNPVVGVHLRWYLANSIFRRAMAKSIASEKVVFLSIHADSLHPSLRGAMAYIPGERYVQGTFSKSGDVYLARSEVRENPTVTWSEEDALRAEGLSTDLAESIVDSLEDRKLMVHSYDPVRDNVVRDGKEWVPAVIRYNKVPTRLLLEICNLGNPADRKLLRTQKYRQEVAEAVRTGIVQYFDDQNSAGGASAQTTASR